MIDISYKKTPFVCQECNKVEMNFLHIKFLHHTLFSVLCRKCMLKMIKGYLKVTPFSKCKCIMCGNKKEIIYINTKPFCNNCSLDVLESTVEYLES